MKVSECGMQIQEILTLGNEGWISCNCTYLSDLIIWSMPVNTCSIAADESQLGIT